MMLVVSILCEGFFEKIAQANLAFTQKILRIVLYRSLKNSGSHHLPALSPHINQRHIFYEILFHRIFQLITLMAALALVR